MTSCSFVCLFFPFFFFFFPPLNTPTSAVLIPNISSSFYFTFLFYFYFFMAYCSKGIQRLAASMNISNAVFCILLVNLSSSESPDADVQPGEGIESKYNQRRLVCLQTSVQLNMNQAFDWVTLERQAVKNKHSKQIKWEADAELNLRRVMKQTEETNRQQTCLRCPSSVVVDLRMRALAYVSYVSLLCSRLLSVCFFECVLFSDLGVFRQLLLNY